MKARGGNRTAIRHRTQNPYASTATLGASGVYRIERRPDLADPRIRLLAYSIDVGYTTLFFVTGMLAMSFIEYNDVILGIVFFAIFAAETVQWYLIATSGQTIGKRINGLQIVRQSDDGPVGSLRGVVFRATFCWIAYFLTLLFFPIWLILVIVNIFLLAYSRDRRCIHDYIAGTCVIDIQKKMENEMAADLPVSAES